jgi:chitinase
MGTYFAGKIWHNVLGPDLPIDGGPPSVSVSDTTWHEIMDTYATSPGANVMWDGAAHASYLVDTAAMLFITYDDERANAEKVGYVHDRGLGGMIIWELAAGYRPAQSGTAQQAQLQAINAAIAGYR